MDPVYFASLDSTWHGLHSVCSAESQVHSFYSRGSAVIIILRVVSVQAWKPPRTHHDSMSGRCVLKMDHYCIWVLNCVGLLNYKAFLLFLVYTFLATFLATAALVNGFVIYFKELQEEDPQPSAK